MYPNNYCNSCQLSVTGRQLFDALWLCVCVRWRPQMYLNVIVCCCLGFVAFSMRPTWLRDIRQVYNQETMSLLPSISVLSLVLLSRSSRAIDVRRLHAKDVTRILAIHCINCQRVGYRALTALLLLAASLMSFRTAACLSVLDADWAS
jgi:hypothetical protein